MAKQTWLGSGWMESISELRNRSQIINPCYRTYRELGRCLALDMIHETVSIHLDLLQAAYFPPCIMEIPECAGNISKISIFFDVLRKKDLIQLSIRI